MPGLIACGRRWRVGSDDLVFPGAAEIMIRGIWMVAIAVVFNVHQESFDCQSGHLVQIFYIGTLVLLSIHILLNILIVHTSMQGSITEVSRRNNIPKYVYIKVAAFLPEFVWITLGTYWAFQDPTDCQKYVVDMVKVVALVGWFAFIFLIIGVVIVFDPLGSTGKESQIEPVSMGARVDGELHGASSAAKRLWETRCKVICCCAASDEQSKNAFSDIAEIFTNFFKGLDLVPTDIAAGLILVQQEQKCQPRRLQLDWLLQAEPSQLYTSEPTGRIRPDVQNPPRTNSNSDGMTEVDPATTQDSPGTSRVAAAPSTSNTPGTLCNTTYPQPKSWMNTASASYYMRFAMASYGWPLYMYIHLPTGCCKLARDSTCCQCASLGEHIVDDNCCQCNTSAIRMITKVDEEDIVYASYHNKVYEIPFYVALDHQNGAVVVAIRGTLSLRDALTDMTAESEELPVPDLPEHTEAHKGILQAACYIHERLQSSQLLHKAFERGTGYQLVIAGHSLGAGAATILSILLKPAYPDLICYAFSPPGGLLSLPLSRYTEDFVCSVVLGKDLVPRLSLVTMGDLRSKVLRVLKNTNKAKYKILAGGCWNALCGLSSPDESESGVQRPLLEGRSNRPSSYSSTEAQVEEAMDDAIVSTNRSRIMNTPLYPPGHIIYIEETEPSSACCGGTPTYEAAWARAESFDEIIVSPKMVSDHLPDSVLKALEQLAERDYAPRHLVKVRKPLPVA